MSTNPDLLKSFTPLVKQHGALLAKGRLVTVWTTTDADIDRLEEILSEQ